MTTEQQASGSAATSSTEAPSTVRGRRATRRSWRRALACGAVALLGVLAVTGCGGPSWSENALVVHVVAPSCDHEPGHQPLLVVERVVGGFGKATTNEWRVLRQLEQCGSPSAGYSWEGDILQVWVSDYEWSLRKQVRVQLGHRVVGVNTWAVGDEDRLRVDYQHVFLGTIDIGVDGSEFVPPGAVEAVAAQLQYRQGCETSDRKDPTRLVPCTDEWEHANLFTFDVTEEAPASPWVSDPPPPVQDDGT